MHIRERPSAKSESNEIRTKQENLCNCLKRFQFGLAKVLSILISIHAALAIKEKYFYSAVLPYCYKHNHSSWF